MLLNAREIVEPLLKQKQWMQTQSSVPQSRQDFSFLDISAYPQPFVVLDCKEDGNCGYHAITHHFFPHWDTHLPEYSEHVLNLKQCTKNFNLVTSSPELQLTLENDYPFLKEDGTVRQNYADNFGKL